MSCACPPIAMRTGGIFSVGFEQALNTSARTTATAGPALIRERSTQVLRERNRLRRLPIHTHDGDLSARRGALFNPHIEGKRERRPSDLIDTDGDPHQIVIHQRAGIVALDAHPRKAYFPILNFAISDAQESQELGLGGVKMIQ